MFLCRVPIPMHCGNPGYNDGTCLHILLLYLTWICPFSLVPAVSLHKKSRSWDGATLLTSYKNQVIVMRSSLVVRASDCQYTSCNGPGFDLSIRRHSGIWGAADEAVLNIVRTKRKKFPPKKVMFFWFSSGVPHAHYTLYTVSTVEHCGGFFKERLVLAAEKRKTKRE